MLDVQDVVYLNLEHRVCTSLLGHVLVDPLIRKCLKEMVWICSKGTCENVSSATGQSWTRQEDCQENCATKMQGVMWVWITVFALVCLLGLLVFVLKGKGDAGMKAFVATEILEDAGSIISSGVSHVAASLNS